MMIGKAVISRLSRDFRTLICHQTPHRCDLSAGFLPRVGQAMATFLGCDEAEQIFAADCTFDMWQQKLQSDPLH